MNDNDYQELPPNSVLRSSARPQADGELKNCFENLILNFYFLIKLGNMDGADDNDLEVDETNPDGLGQLWEDDDTKSFYEILIDLLEIVPAILYKDSKAQVEIQVRSIFNSRFLL